MKFYLWYEPDSNVLVTCTMSPQFDEEMQNRFGWFYIGEL